MKSGKKDRFPIKGDTEVLSVQPLSPSHSGRTVKEVSPLEEGRCVFNEQEPLKGIWGLSNHQHHSKLSIKGTSVGNAGESLSKCQLLITFTWPSTRQPQHWGRLLISSMLNHTHVKEPPGQCVSSYLMTHLV